MDFGLNDDELDDINEKPISRVKVMLSQTLFIIAIKYI
jgi:hypothetical protein